MFDQQQRKFKRSTKLVKILTKYGLKDVLARLNGGNAHQQGTDNQLAVYERIRLAIEELGPTFVKLGQTFSDRDDLLPIGLVEQLRHLQDNVQADNLDVRAIMLEQFGVESFQKFDRIETDPLAAASIAQVYRGRLTDGQEVIIKVKRPGVDAQIKDDLLILKDLIALIDTYTDYADQLNLKHALLAFEKSLLEELSLNHEKSNLVAFRKYFAEDKDTYVPKVYEDFCSDNVLTMEFIDGVKITNIEQLKANQMDLVALSESGYRLFMTQVLSFGMFHADPHAGNLMVTKAQQLVFIDFGAVGRIPKSDKPLFESLILNFLAKKADKIVKLLKKMAIYYAIDDDRQFERDVHELFGMIHNSSLKEISVVEVMNKMKGVLKNNRLVMPEYFYLLFKGVSLLDGVGRQLNPDLDVVKSLKPFTKKIMQERLSPQNIANKGAEKLAELYDDVEQIPLELKSVLAKLSQNELGIHVRLRQFDHLADIIKSSVVNMILGLVLAANIVGTALLYTAGAKLFSVISILVSVLLMVFLVLRLLRR